MRRHARINRPFASLAAAVLLLAAPALAHAHAQLSGTTPAHEETLEQHPDEVRASFSEDVSAPFGAIQVYGPDGERVERGGAEVDDDTVTVPIDSSQAGTYAVSWRVTSADGHPVRGAFVFHVEEESSDQISRDKALAASEGNRAHELAFGVARFAYLAGVLVAVGGMLFAVLAAGSWRPRWMRGALVFALLAMALGYVLDAAIAAGLSLVDALDGDVLQEQASTVYGSASIVRIGVLAACMVATLAVGSSRWQRRWVRWLALVPFVVLGASLSLSGHAVGADVTALRLPLDMVHSLAACAWLGGLVQLVPWSRATPVDPAVLDRWSRVAFGSVVVLVLTGSWAAWEEIGLSLDALVSTTYGRLVIAKVVLLAVTLPLANANRTRNVPAVRRGGSEAVAALRRYVRAEVAILLLVLVATAWLVQSPPAKVELRPDFIDRTVELGGGGMVQLVVDPATVGANEVHMYAFDPQLQVDGDVTDMTLTAWNDKRGLGPLEIELVPSGPGHYTTPRATIPFDGTWRFELGVKRGRFDEERGSFEAHISSRTE